jgi:carbamoyl-phosphate synthase large subunit
MVNCNPETVSTDYDTSDRLYFEPLTLEDVLEVVHAERQAGPIAGVICQLGGQTPLGLAQGLADAGVPIVGTSPEAIHLAEERGAFGRVLADAGLAAPKHGMATSFEQARAIAAEIGYPVLVRPSYVLGGRAMEIVYSDEELERYLRHAAEAGPGRPVLVDRFLEGAIEVDVDAVADGREVHVAAVMEHIEEAGVHSGDSSCVLPPLSLDAATLERVRGIVRRLAPALGVVGLVNVQVALLDGEIYVLEANPRASRTVPFASKATGVNLVDAACRLMAGASLDSLGLPPESAASEVSVKAAVFPFGRFPGADPVLGPEMRSTGEVMAGAGDFPTAFAKAERAAGRPLPVRGRAFLSVREGDKQAATRIARRLSELGFSLSATTGTAAALRAAEIPVSHVRKVSEKGEGPTVVDLVRRGRCDLVVNTPDGRDARSDGYRIREAALLARVPCVTTLAGAVAAVEAIAEARRETALSLQERVLRSA